ncbi:PepSY domain-containing protein [Corynebacterium tapiri]
MLLHRLHALGGVIVAPLILIACITGIGYAAAPTAEKIVYHDLIHTPEHPDSTALPVEDQVKAAHTVYPDLPVAKVQVEEKPGLATRVLFKDDSLISSSYTRVVFVDPVDAHVQGSSVQYGSAAALPLRSWISEGHKRLWLGPAGRWYSELAASWLGALTLVGIFLWWQRTRDRRGRNASTASALSLRARRRKLHTQLGLWLTLVMLFFTATGLTWSRVAGSNVANLRKKLDWIAPNPSGVSSSATGPFPVDGHDGQAAIDLARAEGLTGRLEIRPPASEQTVWLVQEARQEFRMGKDSLAIAMHNGHAHVVDSVSFSEWPFPAKLAEWLINAHMGILFGWPNQLLLALATVGIMVVIVHGYLMWFMRSRAPRPAKWTKIPRSAQVIIVVAIVVYSLVAPLFGISLVAFLLAQWIYGVFKKRRHARDSQSAPAGGVASRR